MYRTRHHATLQNEAAVTVNPSLTFSSSRSGLSTVFEAGFAPKHAENVVNRTQITALVRTIFAFHDMLTGLTASLSLPTYASQLPEPIPRPS